jgi:hypothetical protein
MIISLDPVEFARERLEFNPDPWQADVLRSEAKKIILRCSRQSGKSTTTAALALHKGIYTPGSLILLFSASLRQSRELFRKVRNFLEVFKNTGEDPLRLLTEDNKLEMTLTNGARIVSLPAKEATIRGYSGVDLAVCDEAAYIQDDIYKSLRPMLAVSNGRLILLSTPFGKWGFFWNEWNNPSFEKYHVPAGDCPRITAEFLESERHDLGEFWFKQEYLCQFMDETGSVFTREEIESIINPNLEMMNL